MYSEHRPSPPGLWRAEARKGNSALARPGPPRRHVPEGLGFRITQRGLNHFRVLALGCYKELEKALKVIIS